MDPLRKNGKKPHNQNFNKGIEFLEQQLDWAEI